MHAVPSPGDGHFQVAACTLPTTRPGPEPCSPHTPEIGCHSVGWECLLGRHPWGRDRGGESCSQTTRSCWPSLMPDVAPGADSLRGHSEAAGPQHLLCQVNGLGLPQNRGARLGSRGRAVSSQWSAGGQGTAVRTPPTGLHPLPPHTTSVPLGYVAQSQDAKRKERPTVLSKGIKGGPLGLAISCQ